MDSSKQFCSHPLLLSFVFAWIFFLYDNVSICKCLDLTLYDWNGFDRQFSFNFHNFDMTYLWLLWLACYWTLIHFKDLLLVVAWGNYLPLSRNIKTLSLCDIAISYWEAMTLWNIWMSKSKMVTTESLIL